VTGSTISEALSTSGAPAARLYDCRDAFTATLVDLAGKNRDIVAVCNDSVGSSKLNGFGKAFPERLINVGIAEQNLVGTGAGLANGGKIPFVCGASCFLTGRSLEQIKADVAYSNTNVKLCGISAGMAYGELGPTHHSIEDFAWIRALPNVPIIAPADRIETAAATAWAAAHDGPVFLRLSRVGVPDLLPEGHVFELGRADPLRDGTDLTIIANGVLTHRAMAAAAILAGRGVSARVLNMATVRPIDEAAVVAAARETGAILTCEEHTVFGGLGSAVAEVVVQKAPVPMALLGVPGEFAPTGSANWLLDHYGMSPGGIAGSAEVLVKRKV
jgi:transketolase